MKIIIAKIVNWWNMSKTFKKWEFEENCKSFDHINKLFNEFNKTKEK